jgi:hypothetical protein
MPAIYEIRCGQARPAGIVQLRCRDQERFDLLISQAAKGNFSQRVEGSYTALRSGDGLVVTQPFNRTDFLEFMQPGKKLD